MTLAQALYYKLSNTSGITDLVGTSIYHIKMPQETVYPAITMQFVSGEPRVHTMNSDTGNPAGPIVQISSWDTSTSGARTVACAVKTALQDLTGTMGGAGGVTVERIFTNSNPVEFWDEAGKVYHIAQDYLIWWQET